jgi:hypothetical protein
VNNAYSLTSLVLPVHSINYPSATINTHSQRAVLFADAFSYEANLAKKDFKNLTKDLYITMLLRGGIKKYMSEMFKDHSVPEHTFANIEKGGSLADFSIVDRELERLQNPAHKSQYLSMQSGKTASGGCSAGQGSSEL